MEEEEKEKGLFFFWKKRNAASDRQKLPPLPPPLPTDLLPLLQSPSRPLPFLLWAILSEPNLLLHVSGSERGTHLSKSEAGISFSFSPTKKP